MPQVLVNCLAIIGSIAAVLVLLAAFNDCVRHPFARMRRDARRWRALVEARRATLYHYDGRKPSEETLQESYDRASEVA